MIVVEYLSRLIFNFVIVPCVCVVWSTFGFFMVNDLCCVRKNEENAQPENPKRRKKVKHGGRREERRLLNGHTADTVGPLEIAYVEQAVDETTRTDQTGSGDEDKNENEDDHVDDDKGNDLIESLDVNAEEDEPWEEDSDPSEHSGSSIMQPSLENDSPQEKELQEIRHRNTHHNYLPDYHPARPIIDPSRIARLSDTQNYLRTVEGRRKQRERELDSLHRRISSLENRLRDLRVEGDHLNREKTNVMKRLERIKFLECGLDRDIKDLKMKCVQAKAKFEEKDMLLKKLCARISEIAQAIASHDKDLIFIYKDPIEQLAAIKKAVENLSWKNEPGCYDMRDLLL